MNKIPLDFAQIRCLFLTPENPRDLQYRIVGKNETEGGGGEQGVALGWIESFNGPELIGFRMVITELELLSIDPKP